jgi:putative ABC transport system permease protein
MIVALLAVAIGGTILSGLITIYYDIPRQMGQEFRSYGANFILLPGENETGLSAEKFQEASAYLPAANIVGAAPYRYRMVKINEQPFMAAGTDLAQAQKTSPYWYISGHWPKTSRETLIGAEVSSVIRLPPGSAFTVTGTDVKGKGFTREFTVSGIVQTGGSEEAFIFMSLEDFTDMAGTGDFDVVECSISANGEVLAGLAAEIAENVAGVSPRLVTRVTQSEGVVLTKLQALVYLVTAIVLLLIMICVATTMMAVVAERRREIGLKKALGAANQTLVIEFMGEGIFLGGLGGLLGAVFGFVFAQGVSMNVFNRSINFQPLLIPVTVIASVIITGLASFLPVRSAADVDPAIVLRGE